MSRRKEFVSIKYGSEKIPKQNHLLLVNLKKLYEQFQRNTMVQLGFQSFVNFDQTVCNR